MKLLLSFIIISFFMLGMPIIVSAIAYPDNCKQSILIPCLEIDK
ncbi:hypothetical protein N9E09_00955 [bacterium]|nr:hypothetical protein [bacterium]